MAEFKELLQVHATHGTTGEGDQPQGLEMIKVGVAGESCISGSRVDMGLRKS
jgi:hypothetical protein